MAQAKTSAVGIGDSSVGQVNVTYRTATTTTGAPAAGTFYSSIIGRGPMLDLSADLMPRMGVERITTHAVMLVPSETGPNGEAVYKPVNDRFDQVRFIGQWLSRNDANGTGANLPQAATLEVTFYGTGLNILQYVDNGTYTNTVSIDGGASSNFVNQAYSTALASRNYNQNTVLNVVSGLALGIHTAKIGISAGGQIVFGFDILNEQAALTTLTTTSGSPTATVGLATGLAVGMDITASGVPANTIISAISGTTITMSANATATAGGVSASFGKNFLKIPSGSSSKNGKHLSLASQVFADYKSGFDSGTLGTRGGRVSVYQKKDGSIGKAVTPTGATSLVYPNADHTTEDVTRVYYPREFGAGRTDDFTTLYTTGANRAFALEDNVSFMVAQDMRISSPGGGAVAAEAVFSNGVATDFVTLTFVGTGLDVVVGAQSAGASAIAIVDGVTTTAAFTANAGLSTTIKICSGLPYGTHTVKITSNGTSFVSFNFLIQSFIAYGPKKPALPVGATELAEYFVLANYALATYTTPSSGVIRKSGMKEVPYIGTWGAATIDVGFNCGFNLACNTAAGYLEFTFFGTGIEHSTYMGSSRATNLTVSIDGSTNLSAYTTSLQGPVLGTLTFAAATGLISGTSGAGAGYGTKISVTGLPLGLHKYRITYNSGAENIYADSFDIVTPIHCPKNNGPYIVQNALPVGSQWVGDRRSFGNQLPAISSGVFTRGINTSITTTATIYAPVGEMACSLYVPEDGIYLADFRACLRSSTTGDGFVAIFVDGVQATPEPINVSAFAAGYNQIICGTQRIPLAKGWHLVYLLWKTGSGTETMFLNNANGTTSLEVTKCEQYRP